MTDSLPDHEVLEQLNLEISRENERIADLQSRIRVIEIEVASWKVPPVPAAPRRRWQPGDGSAFLGFWSGLLATFGLGKIIAAVIGR